MSFEHPLGSELLLTLFRLQKEEGTSYIARTEEVIFDEDDALGMLTSLLYTLSSALPEKEEEGFLISVLNKFCAEVLAGREIYNSVERRFVE